MKISIKSQRAFLVPVAILIVLALVMVNQVVSGAQSFPGTVSAASPVWVWGGGGRLHAIDFAGDHGWLVGWYGSVGHTTDGGVTWEGQYAGQTEATFYGVAAADSTNVWALGGNNVGGIYHSSDSGQHWSVQASHSDWDFTDGDIAFVSNNTGWAVGNDYGTFQGLILHTADAGANWSKQTSGTGNAIYGLAVVDANTVWAVGAGGTILHTTDGGTNWFTQTIGTTENLNAIYAISAQNAWVVGTNYQSNPKATVFYTTNGGTTWTQAAVTNTIQHLKDISCSDSSKCWAVGSGATIIHSTDSGVNWTAQNNPVPYGYGLDSIAMQNALKGVIVGEYLVLRTADGGNTWTPWSPIATLKDVDFPATEDGWIAGWDDASAHTTNGGESWNYSNPGISGVDFEGVDFSDSQNGFLVSYTGETLRTTDGGTNWSPGQFAKSPTDLLGVAAWDSTHAWIGGTRYIYGTNNGTNWTRQFTETWYIHDFDFINATKGWAVGETSGGYGKILSTENGLDWSLKWSNIPPMGLRDVTFWDTQTGWAVGEGANPNLSLILYTADGGSSWQTQTPPNDSSIHYKDLEGVVFTSATQGWAVGETATILATSDGGTTWSSEPATSRSDLYGVASDGTNLWAVGADSTILRRIIYEDISPTPAPSPTSPPPSCWDAYETNETFATAHLLDPLDPAGYYAIICDATDEDWYSFDVTLGDLITVTLDDLPKNYDLELYDPDETMVANSSNLGTDKDIINFQASNLAGQYRVRVFGPGGEFSEAQLYHLIIQVGTTLPPALTVNTTDDINDGTCNLAHCSLREAINTANATDSFEIQFAIPESDPGWDVLTWVISPTTALPTVTKRINLDASTQTISVGDSNPNGPEIVLDGTHAGISNGISLQVGATLQDLTIINWAGAGIYARGTIQTNVYGCYIGAGRFGMSSAPNGTGILINGGHSAHIGGSESGQGNLISGNTDYGLHLMDTAYAQVRANLIGTDRTGNGYLHNGDHGVYLSGAAERNTIGGERVTAGNLISGNWGSGVYILSGAGFSGYNKIWGNRIGVNAGATAAIENSHNGVYIQNSNRNTIGHSNPDRGNIIGGNLAGVNLYYANHNQVLGNWIGAEPTGSIHLANSGTGVTVWGVSEYNVIGPYNVIAHNLLRGVRIAGIEAIRNTITKNSITDNNGLGIDVSTGANENISPPILTLVTAHHMEGVACPRCRVELFGDPAGEGIEYDGVVTATVSGTWVYGGSLSWGESNTTATATDGDGNTSEFSTCLDPYESNDDFDQAIPLGLGVDNESYICHPYADDYYAITVEPRSVISIELDIPQNYVLTLFSSDHTQIEQNVMGTPSSRSISHTSFDGGIFYVMVNGLNDAHDSDSPYTLTVSTTPMEISFNSWLDEGRNLSPAVYKLIPDGDGPTNGVWIELNFDAFSRAEETFSTHLDITIPGDVFGEPDEVFRRYCRTCTKVAMTWTDLGAGRYRSALWLSRDHTDPGSYGQLVFRFFVEESDVASHTIVRPEAELRYDETGIVVATSEGPNVHFVNRMGALVITNRHTLYRDYDFNQISNFLSQLTWSSQGMGTGEMWSAIYYVDDFSSEARYWDNELYNLATPNEAHDAIDLLIEDWVEDGGGIPYLLIIGDDDVIPMGRRGDSCTGSWTESSFGTYGETAIDRVITSDQYLTDSWYADTNHSGWGEGEVELAVGRLVGDSAFALHNFYMSGITGPNYARNDRAVLASWDHNDLHFGSAHYASVKIHVEDYGFGVNDALVDNHDWRKSDLLTALETDFQVLISGNHGNPWGIAAPPDKVGIVSEEFSTAISVTAPTNLPFYIFGDCRVGFTLVDDGLIDEIILEGASGIVAGSGITWGYPAGTEGFTEEVFNKFSRRVFNGTGTNVGGALRAAKSAYYQDGGIWYCRDRKAVMQVNLFGVPWLMIRDPDAPEADLPLAGTVAREKPAHPVLFEVKNNTYSRRFDLDASQYTITPTVPGYDFVEIAGFNQIVSLGPSVPEKVISFTLPTGAAITGITAQTANHKDLGILDIPTYIPGVALYPTGSTAAWVDTATNLGLVPTQPYTYVVKDMGAYQRVYVSVLPLQYETTSGQTDLYQQMAITISYTSPLPLALSDFYLDAATYTPGETIKAFPQLDNVTDQNVTVTTTLTLVDEYGNQTNPGIGDPYEILAGGRGIAGATSAAPTEEGSYQVWLEVWQNGSVIAQASEFIQVVAVEISAFAGPEALIPGDTGAFTLTLDNHTAGNLVISPTLMIFTALGREVVTLSAPTQTITGQTQIQVAFSWDSSGTTPGSYQAVAQTIFGTHTPRRAIWPFEMRYAIYLPLVTKGLGP
jgi:CSLREA domain-containing protein